MSVIVLTSACGAPGVTTTTLGLAATWPRPAIAVEADPVGGSSMLAGYFKGFHAPTQSVADLLLADRNGRLSEQLHMSLIPMESTSAFVLPGPRSHAQAHNALELWEPLSMVWATLGAAPDEHGTDVFVDAGRLGMESYPESLLRCADLILLVTRSDLPSLAGTKQWADRALQNRELYPSSPPWAVLLIGVGHPYSAHEVGEVLGLPLAHEIRLDPRGAAVYSAGKHTRPKGHFHTDLISCGAALRKMIEDATHALEREGAAHV